MESESPAEVPGDAPPLTEEELVDERSRHEILLQAQEQLERENQQLHLTLQSLQEQIAGRKIKLRELDERIFVEEIRTKKKIDDIVRSVQDEQERCRTRLSTIAQERVVAEGDRVARLTEITRELAEAQRQMITQRQDSQRASDELRSLNRQLSDAKSGLLTLRNTLNALNL